MALAGGLIDVEEYSRYLGYPVPTDPDKIADVEWAIRSATAAIETYCGRGFQAKVSSARYYDTDDWFVVWFGDCVSVSDIAVDSGANGTFTALTATDYQLLPLGGQSVSLGSVPYMAARRVGGMWPRRGLSTRQGLIRVTAVWGWSAVPDPVKRATAVFAQDMLRDREAVFGGVVSTSEGVTIMSRMPRRVTDLCDPYRRMDVAVGMA